MLRLILLGANKFGAGLSGATLQGCINDLWSVYKDAIADFNVTGVDVVGVLANERFTKSASVYLIENALAKCVKGDALWVHLSSHGTKGSFNGQTHHMVCCYDSNFNDQAGTFLTDDDFIRMFFNAPKDVRIFVTSDSCYSGNLIRGLKPFTIVDVDERTPRFIEPPEDVQIQIAFNEASGKTERGVGATFLASVCFISGCGENQTSDDVRDQTGAYGAFTNALTKISKRGIKAGELATKVNAYLAERQFTQRPQVNSKLDWVWAEGVK